MRNISQYAWKSRRSNFTKNVLVINIWDMVQSFNQPRRQGQKRVGKGRAEFGNGVTMVVTMVGGLFGSQKVFWGGEGGGFKEIGSP